MERIIGSPKITLRQATPADVPALRELNVAAYPILAVDNVIWNEQQLLSHQRIFPEGQLVAELSGRLVGAAATLLVSLPGAPLRHHTWSEATAHGYFTNHDDGADTLYGADVYVHPEARGLGVGAALYEARRELCRRLNKRRILAGGRLWNYAEAAASLSPERYAALVVSGERRDLVLSFQLREGFVLHGVMPGYLKDSRSKNYATLIEWLNPDHVPAQHRASA